MEFNAWSIAEITAKVFVYGGFAAAIGGISTYFLSRQSVVLKKPIRRYLLTLIIPALIAVPALFFIKVGELSDSGLMGMVDPLMLPIVWQTHAGSAMLVRLVGIGSLLLAVLTMQATTAAKSLWLFLFYLIGAVLVAISFALVGHTSQLPVESKLLLAAHMITLGWWVGSLWPLVHICRVLPKSKVKFVMKAFSLNAMVAVSVLVLSGSILLWQLVGGWAPIIETNYGRLLGVKLLFVCAMFALAVRHKVSLTPNLVTDSNAIRTLERSIRIELGLAIGVLVLISVATTVVGPMHP